MINPLIVGVSRAVVIVSAYSVDTIVIHTTLPTSFPEMKCPTCFTVHARAGSGAQWVRDVIGVEPEVVGP